LTIHMITKYYYIRTSDREKGDGGKVYLQPVSAAARFRPLST